MGIDPAQGMPSTFATANPILGQGAVASAKAAAPNSPSKAIELRNTTSSGAFDVRAYIDSSCCSPVNPVAELAGAAQAVGFYGTADRSINLAYRIGTIGAHKLISIGYEYAFTTPTVVPEPETYAMMLAGLGLMGFVARRRRQNYEVAKTAFLRRAKNPATAGFFCVVHCALFLLRATSPSRISPPPAPRGAQKRHHT